MAEPNEISLRAAEAASDVTEAEREQDRGTLATAFSAAASSSARVAGRGTRAARRQIDAVRRGAGSGTNIVRRGAGSGTSAVRRGAGSGTKAVRRGAGSGTNWLAGQVAAMAPRLRVRDLAALRQQLPGLSDEEIADALIERASHASAAAGGAVGVWAALPALPAFPAEVAAETLVLVGIEIKLIAELHEVYGTPAPGNFAERMSAYVAAWAHRRGVYMIPGGVVLATGSPLARLLRRRLAARAGRSAFALAPLLTGAAAGAYFNSRETRRLGQDIRRDLRRRALPPGS
jgi:hypothetical protein